MHKPSSSNRSGIIWGVVSALWAALVLWKFIPWWLSDNARYGFLSSAARRTMETFAGFQWHKLGSVLAMLAAAVCMTAAWSGLGEAALRVFRFPPMERRSRFVFSTGLGIGIFSFAVLGLGLLGFLQPAALWSLLILAAALRVVLLLKPWKAAEDTPVGAEESPSGFSERLAVIFGLCILLFVWLGAMAPVEDADSLMYHLALPRMYLEAGRIHYIPFVFHANWPLLSEMIYLWGLGIHIEKLAQAGGFIFGALTAGVVWATARRRGGRRAGIWAAAIFLSLPVALKQISVTGSDMSLCLFTTLALAALLEWDTGADRKFLGLSAVFAGLAVCCKLTGATALVILCAIALWREAARTKSARDAARTAALYAAIGLAIPLPWLIRSAVWTGNPVWPFLYGVFGGRNWNALAARDYFYFVHEYYRMASAAEFHRIGVHLMTGLFEFSVGVLMPLSALLVFTRVSRRSRALWACAAAMSIAWLLVSQQARFLIPALAAWALLVGIGLAQLRGAVRRVTTTLAVLALLFTTIWAWAYFSKYSDVTLGEKSREDFLARVPAFDAAWEVNHRTPRDAVILLMWDSQSYYIRRPVVWGDPIDQGVFNYCSYHAPEEFSGALRRQGVTHVLFHMLGLQTKVKLDQQMRHRMHLAPLAPSGVLCAATIQKALINRGEWRELYHTPLNDYYLFEIRRPPVTRSE